MSRFKILIADGMAADAVQALKANASFEVEFRKETSSAELLNLVPHFDALLVRSATQVTPEVLDRATRLKLVLRLGAGVDNIDVKYAKSKNIEVMNTASANAQSAAEHAIALMFALARHIPQAYASLKRGEWNRSQFVGFELTGKALAIIGFGQIGRIVAEKALGLGMRVMAYDPMVEEAPAHLRAVELVKDLKELVSRADLVTLHLPKIPATSNLLNGDLFSHFKK